MRFGLGGDKGLAIFDAGYPKAQSLACDSTAPVDGVEETVAAGKSSLSYDSSTGFYTYVWKTDKSWVNTCRQLVLKLNDNVTGLTSSSSSSCEPAPPAQRRRGTGFRAVGERCARFGTFAS